MRCYDCDLKWLIYMYWEYQELTPDCKKFCKGVIMVKPSDLEFIDYECSDCGYKWELKTAWVCKKTCPNCKKFSGLPKKR